MLPYDRLVVAAGSHGFQPPIPGLSDFGHSVNDRAAAVALDKHLQALADRPASPARDTVVVVGGGFTGIEVATEMPDRLREILGQRSEEHTSELQSLMRISYAVFCLKKKNKQTKCNKTQRQR